LDIQGIQIDWLGHASFRISSEGKTIYLDPWRIKKGEKPADLILITHSHYDHLSPDDVRRVQGDETIVVATKDSASKLKGKIEVVKPGDEITVGNIEIKTIPAYNIGKSYHPKTSGWAGYIVNIGGRKVYHAGDTDAIPEMKRLKVDIALLPVGGTYTMTAEEAAQIANEFNPTTAIPMHWGTIVGSRADAERFKELFQGETVIPIP